MQTLKRIVQPLRNYVQFFRKLNSSPQVTLRFQNDKQVSTEKLGNISLGSFLGAVLKKKLSRCPSSTSEKVECDPALQQNSVQHEIISAIISQPSVAQTNHLHNPLTEMKGLFRLLVVEIFQFPGLKALCPKGSSLWLKEPLFGESCLFQATHKQ